MVSNQIAVVTCMLLLDHKFVDELACAIKDVNVDYMLVCGDFNCVVKKLYSIISG